MRRFINNFGWPIVCGLLLALAFLSWNQNRQLRAILQHPALVDGYLSKLEIGRPASTGTSIANTNSAVAHPRSYAAAVNTAIPSVVEISTRRFVAVEPHPLTRDPLFNQFLNNRQQLRQRVESGLGSGVIVYASGLILTNYHVIKGADQIGVTLHDGRQQMARIIGVDEATDLALLAIDLEDLPAVEFADIDTVAIGDVVLAIGNPYGYGQTVTQGIVSALDRHDLNLNAYENYVQTDAAINRGNSGGALVNTDGHLVGINSALRSSAGGSNGIGFAIPADVARFVLDNLMQHGRVIRGWLGISVDEITPQLATRFGLDIDRGLILTAVAPDGPAERAGLMPGDIITHIGEQEIGDGNTGMHVVAHSPPGQALDIRLRRGNMPMSLSVVLDERPTPINQSRA